MPSPLTSPPATFPPLPDQLRPTNSPELRPNPSKHPGSLAPSKQPTSRPIDPIGSYSVEAFDIKKLQKQAHGLSQEETIAFWQRQHDGVALFLSKAEESMEKQHDVSSTSLKGIDMEARILREEGRAIDPMDVAVMDLSPHSANSWEMEVEQEAKVFQNPVAGFLAGIGPPAGAPAASLAGIGHMAGAHEGDDVVEGKDCLNSLPKVTSNSSAITSLSPSHPTFPPKNQASHLKVKTNSNLPFPSNPNVSVSTNYANYKPSSSSKPNLNLWAGQTVDHSQLLTIHEKSTVKPNLTNTKLPSNPAPSLAKGGPATLSNAVPFNKKPSPWIDLLKSSTQRMELNYVKPCLNDNGLLTLSKGTSEEGEVLWKHTLVGYSIDQRLPFKLVQQRVFMLWGKFGIKEVRVNKEGFFFFTFNSREGANQVLMNGPWIVVGQQIFLKPWQRNFDFRKEEFKTLPNWVKFYGIPTTYWSPTGFSAIASHVGTPLYTDEITSSAKLLDFARICVEMQVGSTFPTSFKVQSEFDEEFEVRVEYGWRPRECGTCKVFGHSSTSCPKNKHVEANTTIGPQWVYKSKNQPKTTIPETPNSAPVALSPVLEPLVGTKPLKTAPESSSSVEPISRPKPGNSLDFAQILPSSNRFMALDELRKGNEALCGLDFEVDQGNKGLEIISVGEKEVGLEVVPLAIDMAGGECSSSPIGWGHKVVMVDELDKKKKNKSLSTSKYGNSTKDIASLEVYSDLFHIGNDDATPSVKSLDLMSGDEGDWTSSSQGKKVVDGFDFKRTRKSKGKKKKGSRGS